MKFIKLGEGRGILEAAQEEMERGGYAKYTCSHIKFSKNKECSNEKKKRIQGCLERRKEILYKIRENAKTHQSHTD